MRPAVHAAITRVSKQKIKAGEGPPSPDDPGWGAEGGVRRASPSPPSLRHWHRGVSTLFRGWLAGWQVEEGRGWGRPGSRTGAGAVQGSGRTCAYVRFRVWKILEICSMTGPVSGSFIHWVLFSGFSSMSSNAAGRTRQGRLRRSSRHAVKYHGLASQPASEG